MGTAKGMLSKARNWEYAPIGAQRLGNMEGRFFLRAILFRGNSIKFLRDIQNAL